MPLDPGTRLGCYRILGPHGGHNPPDRLEIIRELLDWLDERLDPVRMGDAGIRNGGPRAPARDSGSP